MPNTERLLELALKGLQAERARIDDEIAQLKNQLNSRVAPGPISAVGESASAASKRRTMSAEARKKISEAMKRRHAQMKKAAKK
jgi:hypothetical protein